MSTSKRVELYRRLPEIYRIKDEGLPENYLRDGERVAAYQLRSYLEPVEGMFSAIGTVAITVTGRLRRAASRVVATTAAAPAISEVMFSIFAAGLMEIPPVSKVMPLPTSATFLSPPR